VAFLHNAPDTRPEKRTGMTYKGEEIVLAPVRGTYNRGIEKRNGWYPDEKRIEVVTLWACIGSAQKCAELSKVPVGTVKAWSRTPWFKELLEEIRHENNEKLDAKFTLIAEQTQDLILDRLEHGDYVILKDGTQTRKPINAKDLALVSAITIDKRQIIRNKPTSISQNVSSGEVSEDKLQKLAQTFIDLVNKKENKEEKVIEGEVIDVTPEQPSP